MRCQRLIAFLPPSLDQADLLDLGQEVSGLERRDTAILVLDGLGTNATAGIIGDCPPKEAMKRIVPMLLLVLMLLAACSPKIDATNSDTFKTSVDKIKADLKPEEREKFDRALLVILADNAGSILQSVFTPSKMDEVKVKLHGKTASDVIEEAERIRKTR